MGSDEGTAPAADEPVDADAVGADGADGTPDENWVIERAVLNESEAGRQIQLMFVEHFGSFMRDDLRPILRQVAADGGHPQLLVNGLAELMRSVAESIEFPLDHPRAGFPPQLGE